MDQSPYTAPEAELETRPVLAVPEKILKKIKNAWIAGLISIVITLVAIVMALSGRAVSGLDFNYYAFIEVILMAILSYGIYRNSRISAILLFLLFAANKFILWQESGAVQGLAVAVVFLWFYAQGVVGTFQYHAYVENPEPENPDPDGD